MLALISCLCLSCPLNLKGTNQALFISVFLAPPTVPGPGQCHISAPCLQSDLISASFFIRPARRTLFQPEKIKECLHPSLVPLGAAGPESPRRPRAWGARQLWGLALLGRGLADQPPSAGGHLGSHLEASRGRHHAGGHNICCLSGDARWWGFGRAPSRSVSLLTHSEAPKCKGETIMCFEMTGAGSRVEPGNEGAHPCCWYLTALTHQRSRMDSSRLNDHPG